MYGFNALIVIWLTISHQDCKRARSCKSTSASEHDGCLKVLPCKASAPVQTEESRIHADEEGNERFLEFVQRMGLRSRRSEAEDQTSCRKAAKYCLLRVSLYFFNASAWLVSKEQLCILNCLKKKRFYFCQASVQSPIIFCFSKINCLSYIDAWHGFINTHHGQYYFLPTYTSNVACTPAFISKF